MPSDYNMVWSAVITEPGVPEVMIEVTQAHSGELGTFTAVTLPFDAFRDSPLAGKCAFKGLPTGIIETDTMQVKVDLAALGGDAGWEAFRDVILHPGYPAGGVISTTDYNRYFTTHNLWRFYGPVDDITESRPLLWEGVQRPLPSVKGTAGPDGSILLVIDLVSVSVWLFSAVLMTDVCAAGQAVGGSPEGPYRHCYEELYASTGGTRIYAYAHGIPDVPPEAGGVGTSYPEFTFQPLTVLYDVIESVLQTFYRALVRRGTGSTVFVFSPTGASSGDSSVLDHWVTYAHDHTDAGTHDAATVIPPADRFFLAVTTLHDATTQVTGGLFAYGTARKEDTLERWKTLADFFNDTTTAAFAKIISYRAPFTEDFGLGMYPVDAGPEYPAIDPVEFKESPDFEVGAMRQTAAKGAITGAGSSDVPDIGYVPDFGMEEEETFPLPAGFHTSATLWDAGTEMYSGGFDVISPAATDGHIAVVSPNPNPWVLYYKTDAGGLLTADRMLRLHRYTTTSDGPSVVDMPLGSPADVDMPAPALPLSAQTKEAAQDAFGNPLRLALLRAQRSTSMPAVACYAIVVKFGGEYQTTYDSDQIPLPLAGPHQVGCKADDTLFADGNDVTLGADYLGDLPGAPIILSSDYNLLGKTVRATMLGTTPL